MLARSTPVFGRQSIACGLLMLATPGLAPWGHAAAPKIDIPENFPTFTVPGHEAQMESLRRLFWLHYENAGPLIPLWDEWMPMATLWPASGSSVQRARWAAALAGRGMSTDGYIHTHQHDGLAHAEGWPFPLWMQAGGIGWHFRGTGVGGYDAPPATPEGWGLIRARGGEINERGWPLELLEPDAAIQTPAMAIDARISPWLRLNWWAAGLEGANCCLEWTTRDAPDFASDRRMYLSPASARPEAGVVESRTMIPVHRLAGWKGTITGVRIRFDNAASAQVIIKSFHTACDTRHNINNTNWIRGCCSYFAWTRDFTLLRGQIGRMRTALRFMMREFDTRRRNCVYTTWPGHEGRSGIRYVDGKKMVIPGEGIGSNYWDLLPFGGEDALASIYYYDTLLDFADLEAQIAAHPEWNVATGADAFDPSDLRRHAEEVRAYGRERFWNPETERFGTVDLDGNLHEYGFTFLNNEAIYYDFATAEQARSIRAWINGERTVPGDTSSGADIYHWRFGPRATTKRNIDYYFWGWTNPESIPFGSQVQDGGGVLGFSYHDLMAELAARGPDRLAGRLAEICAWFDETQAAGGYRAYYSDPARGTLQGGNIPGGLGIDREFFESILVPQVMLYGFLGFEPSAEGFRLDPKLPKAWPSVSVENIALHDLVLRIRADSGGIEIWKEGRAPDAMRLGLPAGGWTLEYLDPAGKVLRQVRIAEDVTQVVLDWASATGLRVKRVAGSEARGAE